MAERWGFDRLVLVSFDEVYCHTRQPGANDEQVRYMSQ